MFSLPHEEFFHKFFFSPFSFSSHAFWIGFLFVFADFFCLIILAFLYHFIFCLGLSHIYYMVWLFFPTPFILLLTFVLLCVKFSMSLFYNNFFSLLSVCVVLS